MLMKNTVFFKKGMSNCREMLNKHFIFLFVFTLVVSGLRR